jgi:two-component system cell cycle response regulator DivK
MSGELILIVEDNERNLRLARDLLRVKGFRTLEALTGAAGIDLARRYQPDLVLMDVQLPDIGGEAALATLRSEPGTAGLRVVAVTAFAMREDRERLLRAGFADYISKPISVRTFPQQIAALCALNTAGGEKP